MCERSADCLRRAGSAVSTQQVGTPPPRAASRPRPARPHPPRSRAPPPRSARLLLPSRGPLRHSRRARRLVCTRQCRSALSDCRAGCGSSRRRYNAIAPQWDRCTPTPCEFVRRVLFLLIVQCKDSSAAANIRVNVEVRACAYIFFFIHFTRESDENSQSARRGKSLENYDRPFA